MGNKQSEAAAYNAVSAQSLKEMHLLPVVMAHIRRKALGPTIKSQENSPLWLQDTATGECIIHYHRAVPVRLQNLPLVRGSRMEQGEKVVHTLLPDFLEIPCCLPLWDTCRTKTSKIEVKTPKSEPALVLQEMHSFPFPCSCGIDPYKG